MQHRATHCCRVFVSCAKESDVVQGKELLRHVGGLLAHVRTGRLHAVSSLTLFSAETENCDVSNRKETGMLSRTCYNHISDDTSSICLQCHQQWFVRETGMLLINMTCQAGENALGINV